MNLHIIEAKVTEQFKIACVLIGHENANTLFDKYGLNDDATWKGKASEAADVVEALFCSKILEGLPKMKLRLTLISCSITRDQRCEICDDKDILMYLIQKSDGEVGWFCAAHGGKFLFNRNKQ